MKNKWTERVIFWLLVIVPFVGIFVGERIFGLYFFGISLIIYAFIYRPALNIIRLLRLGIITKNEIWKFVVNPLRDMMYTKSIWLG